MTLVRGGSLRARVVGAVLVTVVATLAVAGWLAWTAARDALDARLDGHLAEAATLLVVQQGIEVPDGDFDLDVPALSHARARVAFQVFRGAVLRQYSTSAADWPATRAGLPDHGFVTVLRAGQAWRLFVAQGQEHDLHVVVGEQIAARDTIARAVLGSQVLPWLAALPVLVGLVLLAVRLALAPLTALTAELASRDQNLLMPLAPVPAPVELQPVRDALDRLFARLAVERERERRFIADAAHELLTPVATIRAQVQVAAGSITPDQQAHSLERALLGCDRASHLVRQLLQLSRLEHADAAGQGPVDLAPLVRASLAAHYPQATQRDQTLMLCGADPCPALADAGLMEILLRNLVDNGLRYGVAGGTLRVTLAQERRICQLTVENSGPPPDAAVLAQLGERFYRALGTGASGSGLGISIVTRIVAVQNGTLDFSASPDLGGLRVRIGLPAPVV